MKQIQANSVGSCWRSDVFNAAKFGPVEVVDLDGKRLGVVGTSKDSIGRVSFRMNGIRAKHETIWSKMHEWSDVVSRQNSERYCPRCHSHSVTKLYQGVCDSCNSEMNRAN
jgi:hypothetical protein